MTKFRAERMQRLMQAELSDIIRSTVKDPRVGFVSVTDVEVSRDLRHVKAFVSVMGDQAEQKITLDALNGAEVFIRAEIGKRVRLKHTPEVIFRLDRSLEHGAQINALLHQIEKQTKQEPENVE